MVGGIHTFDHINRRKSNGILEIISIMPRQTKTIEELNNDLNNLKCRYELEALDIDRLLINYHRYDTAKKYLSRNKDKPSNDPQIIEKRRIVSENHEAYKKYRSIQNIENKITRLVNEYEFRDCYKHEPMYEL